MLQVAEASTNTLSHVCLHGLCFQKAIFLSISSGLFLRQFIQFRRIDSDKEYYLSNKQEAIGCLVCHISRLNRIQLLQILTRQNFLTMNKPVYVFCLFQEQSIIESIYNRKMDCYILIIQSKLRDYMQTKPVPVTKSKSIRVSGLSVLLTAQLNSSLLAKLKKSIPLMLLP